MICPYKNNKQTLHVFEAKILQFLKKYLTLGGNLIYCLSIFFMVVVVPCISDTFVTFAGNYFHLVKVFLRWTFYSCSMLWLPLEYLKKSIMVARKNTVNIIVFNFDEIQINVFFTLSGLKELQNYILIIIRCHYFIQCRFMSVCILPLYFQKTSFHLFVFYVFPVCVSNLMQSLRVYNICMIIDYKDLICNFLLTR